MHINTLVLGDKAVNAEARATLCEMKNLRIGESKIRTHKEREIGTKNLNYILESNSYKRQQQQQQPLQRLQGHFI